MEAARSTQGRKTVAFAHQPGKLLTRIYRPAGVQSKAAKPPRQAVSPSNTRWQPTTWKWTSQMPQLLPRLQPPPAHPYFSTRHVPVSGNQEGDMSEGEGTPMDEDPTEEDLVRGRGNRKNNESDWCQVGKNGRVVKNVAGLGENRQRQTPGQYDQPPAKKEMLGQSSIEGQERRPNSTLLGRDLPSGPLLTHLNIRDSSPGSTGLVEALTMLQAMRAPPRPPAPLRAPASHQGRPVYIWVPTTRKKA